MLFLHQSLKQLHAQEGERGRQQRDVWYNMWCSEGRERERENWVYRKQKKNSVNITLIKKSQPNTDLQLATAIINNERNKNAGMKFKEKGWNYRKKIAVTVKCEKHKI